MHQHLAQAHEVAAHAVMQVAHDALAFELPSVFQGGVSRDGRLGRMAESVDQQEREYTNHDQRSQGSQLQGAHAVAVYTAGDQIPRQQCNQQQVQGEVGKLVRAVAPADLPKYQHEG